MLWFPSCQPSSQPTSTSRHSDNLSLLFTSHASHYGVTTFLVATNLPQLLLHNRHHDRRLRRHHQFPYYVSMMSSIQQRTKQKCTGNIDKNVNCIKVSGISHPHLGVHIFLPATKRVNRWMKNTTTTTKHYWRWKWIPQNMVVHPARRWCS